MKDAIKAQIDSLARDTAVTILDATQVGTREEQIAWLVEQIAEVGYFAADILDGAAATA